SVRSSSRSCDGGVPVRRSYKRLACSRAPAIASCCPNAKATSASANAAAVLVERRASPRRVGSRVLFMLVMPGLEFVGYPSCPEVVAARTKSAILRQLARTIRSGEWPVKCLKPQTSRGGDSTDSLARACSLAATMSTAFNSCARAHECEQRHALRLTRARCDDNSGFVAATL